MIYKLIIKGNPLQAGEAARGRGFKHLVVTSHTARETILRASGEVHALTAWFTEPIMATPGEGFPVGSLLHYEVIP